ncbi:CaiB/BaiF CoA-transferase family protein [Pelagibius sp. Alg239-R121]|uniref:CaiB/BaiF CoA transferase family protein n=1 Tax=Pelagibius sp. Alg239-R121 TaxID=2993448 RepID=UPI0024A771C0|nr:CaiB/BaiF CoA-transferase family protein [Pelagibius sp. Alg239-R121]
MGLNNELEGVMVVSVEQAVSAPYCGLLLADSGARVIKVERPEGDFARAYDKGADGQGVFFAWINRGKESVCVNLDEPSDAALLQNMLQRADVFLHNLAPGSLAKRGFTGTELRRDNPRLITCEITGYGHDGEALEKKAYDLLVQAESGLCAVTGTPEMPARVGISICDIATGLTAYSAVLRALIQRGRTGVGIDLSISMFDVMADWMNMPLLGHRYLSGAPARTGLSHALIVPYGAYSTSDGSKIMIAIQNNREWRNFCDKVLERPDLCLDPKYANNPDRVANRSAVDEAIEAVFQEKDRDELMAVLGAARIACARLSSVEDLTQHTFLRNLQIQFGGAEVTVADLPVQIDGARATEVPVLNQHGSSIRQEFGS